MAGSGQLAAKLFKERLLRIFTLLLELIISNLHFNQLLSYYRRVIEQHVVDLHVQALCARQGFFARQTAYSVWVMRLLDAWLSPSFSEMQDVIQTRLVKQRTALS